MTEIAIPEKSASSEVVRQMAVTLSPLALWAAEAHEASMVAKALALTSFVPASMRGKDNNPDKANEITIGNVTAAILTGQELGLPPMAAMRSMDIVQGVPGLRAHAMRGLVQSHGHRVQLVGKPTPTLVVMRGKRKGEREWQEVEWTIERARLLGLTGKDQWKKQAQTMLIARATGEICRLIASDVLHAAPYAAEELDPMTAATLGSTAVSVTTEEILGAIEPTAVIQAGGGKVHVGGYDLDLDNYDGSGDVPHDDHPDGEYDAWCRRCQLESASAGREAPRPDYLAQAEKASSADEFRAVADSAAAAGHMDEALRGRLAEVWKAKSASAPASQPAPAEAEPVADRPADGGGNDDQEELDRAYAAAVENCPDDWDMARLNTEFAGRYGGVVLRSGTVAELRDFLKWMQECAK